MFTKVSVSTTYSCSLERAFKTPMLIDVSRVHTGMGVMPAITHSSDDEGWGVPGCTKKVYATKSIASKAGYASMDKVLERIENEYWKIEVSDFQSWMLGFFKFEGEWRTTELSPNTIQIDYTYRQYFKMPFLYPLNWMFTNLFWKKYMKQVLENIRIIAESDEPIPNK